MSVSDLEVRSASVAVWRRVRSALSGIRWYFTTLMGDRAYDVYVAHHRAEHPDAPIPTERQFWHDRMAEQDRNPGARCC
ncbi:YbdD/YjiX family protein [Microbacterium sp.]|uniref:YbdD/YjiX family protein n=1 Tax=Microbacterium sp. TaxID=51671 RepID=UPI00281154D7|nr:YbdD/YjiX family protein [Microbacterium sp.]